MQDNQYFRTRWTSWDGVGGMYGYGQHVHPK